MSFLSELFDRLTALDAEANELGIATMPAVAGWLSTTEPIEEEEEEEEDQYYDEE